MMSLVWVCDFLCFLTLSLTHSLSPFSILVFISMSQFLGLTNGWRVHNVKFVVFLFLSLSLSLRMQAHVSLSLSLSLSLLLFQLLFPLPPVLSMNLFHGLISEWCSHDASCLERNTPPILIYGEGHMAMVKDGDWGRDGEAEIAHQDWSRLEPCHWQESLPTQVGLPLVVLFSLLMIVLFVWVVRCLLLIRTSAMKGW